MDQLSLQPVFHMINSFLPSTAAFLVLSAVVMGLPARSGKGEKLQPKRAASSRMKLQRVAPTGGMKSYRIPTSMRPRQRDW